jgi:hypothetical protein
MSQGLYNVARPLSSSSSLVPISEQLQQLQHHRNEFENYLCLELVDIILNNIDKIIKASKTEAKRRGESKHWTELYQNFISDGFNEIPEEDVIKSIIVDGTSRIEKIENLMRQTVWAQATLLSKTCNKACKETVKIPTPVMFIKMVTREVGLQIDPETFEMKSIAMMNDIRVLIQKTIVTELLKMIPTKIFSIETMTSSSTGMSRSSSSLTCDSDKCVWEENSSSQNIPDGFL